MEFPMKMKLKTAAEFAIQIARRGKGEESFSRLKTSSDSLMYNVLVSLYRIQRVSKATLREIRFV